MQSRLPRWTWVLVLPLVVGALMLMHGLDANAGRHHPPSDAAVASVGDHVHDEYGAHLHASSSAPMSDHCIECLGGHVMVACMAVITTVVAGALARRGLRGKLVTALASPHERVVSLAEAARPPGPAWVRLSVMRC